MLASVARNDRRPVVGTIAENVTRSSAMAHCTHEPSDLHTLRA
jgi:hypothetical protein